MSNRLISNGSTPPAQTAASDERRPPCPPNRSSSTPPPISPPAGRPELFRGADHGIDVSFFLNHAAPGSGAEAHRHPYAEVFVVLDGDVAFTVEGRDHAARGGHVVVVPAGAAHAFRNAGDGTLEMVSIHPAAAMETEWLEAS